MESIQEKLFPSNRFRLVALSPDAKEERRTAQLIRGHYTNWSPGGRWIAFDAYPDGNANIYVISADGGSPRRLTTEGSQEILPS